ncbi:diiron oxygenase [Streptomyces sp. NBC_01023]|uniref:diiron oxygenase n=1 Tax=unclassified Streptomyces TaxID=2593676 RepID=UPI0030DF0D66|nr:diiron oxygenase [Streptomyces sp. NBC_01023]
MQHLRNKNSEQRLIELTGRLSRMATEDYYNPYRLFSWPQTLPEDELWMSEDLLSVSGTEVMNELSREQLLRLAKWESINFYSVNVHGIRELLTEVTSRLYAPGFEEFTDFLHHFIGEENEHAWFFAEFCRRYGGRVYALPGLKTQDPADRTTENFLVFAKILIFEEIVDYFNERMAEDASLPETVRQVNRVHHKDESRHIAFGRQLVEVLYSRVRDEATAQECARLEQYLKRYVTWCVQSLYSPAAYRDAGLAEPLALRSRILRDETRRQAERRYLRRPLTFLTKVGIFQDQTIQAV